jgi:hypothetical protein
MSLIPEILHLRLEAFVTGLLCQLGFGKSACFIFIVKVQ